MDAIADDVLSDSAEIIETHGVDVSLYVSPTYSHDDEGKATITLDTAVSAKCLLFQDRPIDINEEEEGIDTITRYVCYFKSTVGSITESSVILYNSEYYKVVELSQNPLEDESVTFYGVQIEKIRDQTTVS